MCERIFALGAHKRHLTGVDEGVSFQAVGPSGGEVALVAVVFLLAASCFAREFALGARERLLTAMNQLVLFQVAENIG